MSKGGKVVHLSDELHARLRAYCAKNELPMKLWVEAVITDALTEDERSSLVKVLKKQPPTAVPDTGAEPWALPPFWARCSDRKKPS